MEYDRKRDPEKYAAHLARRLSDACRSARVFKNWTVEEFEVDPATLHRLGRRLGLSRLTRPSWSAATSKASALYVDHEAYMIGCEIDQLPDALRPRAGLAQVVHHGRQRGPETISYMQQARLSEDQRGGEGAAQRRGGHRLPAELRHRGASALPHTDRRA
jgi:phage terminase large subunit